MNPGFDSTVEDLGYDPTQYRGAFERVVADPYLPLQVVPERYRLKEIAAEPHTAEPEPREVETNPSAPIGEVEVPAQKDVVTVHEFVSITGSILE